MTHRKSPTARSGASVLDVQNRQTAALLVTGELRSAIFNSAHFSSIATDANGVIQSFNVGAERMLGYTAAEVVHRITLTGICDPEEVIARRVALGLEFATPIAPGVEALVYKAARGCEDIYELTYIRKDESRLPVIVAVTAVRDARNAILGYLFIGTDDTARLQTEAFRKQLELALAAKDNELSKALERKQASEDRLLPLEQSIERMLEGIQIIDRQWRYVYVNAAAGRHGRSSAAELVGRTMMECYPGIDATPLFATLSAVMVTRSSQQVRTEFLLPDGATGWFELSIEPDPSGIMVRSVDITEHKQADNLLLKAGMLQTAIFNSSNFSCIATDAAGIIQIFNVGAERMLGYSAADVVNKITPADLHDPQEVIARAAAMSVEFGTPIAPGFEALVFKAARGIEDIYELTKVRKDGSRFPGIVSVTALRNANEVIGYLLIGTDNTARMQVEEERKKLDQRLRDQQFYTRSLIESNIDALITTDPLGIISDVNKQMETLTGCTRDELIGAPFKNHFTDPERAEAAIKQVLVVQKVNNFELTARARDGTETIVSYNATTIHDRERKLQGVLAAVRDMTQLKRIEQALQQKNVELEDASRMKSEFLANMSHELRTPLNAIIGFSEVLRDGLLGEMPNQQRGFIGDIFDSGKHLLSLINDILDLSKVEAGKMLLELEPVQISSLLANSLSIVREKTRAHHIRLEMDVAEDIESIQVDARKVKQIVYNLLSNAVKFTAEGGHVTLSAGLVPRAEVGRLSVSRTSRTFPLADSVGVNAPFDEFLKISVIDDGIGISPEGLAHLFAPFHQIDGGLGRKFEGTGLGLAMVKLFAELHGGAVAVESAVGEGSCFTVWLPVRASKQEAPASNRAPAAPHHEMPEGARVALVVEDDTKAADLLRVLLEAEGFKVLHAASAEAGLALAVQQPLSLITLDTILPQMDGWEFLGRLKQIPHLQRIPVVIISIVADRNKGFALGAAAVIQKPASRQELYESFVALGLFPASLGHTLKVLIVDDDRKAVELVAARVLHLAGTVLRAYGGREAIETAQKELPDLIVLDLMMPEVNGFDVVEALKLHPDTARIPILVVTAKVITAEDRAKLNGYVTTIMEKTEFDRDRFTAEVRRATSSHQLVA